MFHPRVGRASHRTRNSSPNAPLSRGLKIKIPTIVPIKGRGFINHGSGLNLRGSASRILFGVSLTRRNFHLWRYIEGFAALGFWV